MNPEIFKKQMDRLADTFGPKNYQGERTKVFWDAIASEHDDVVTEAVTHLIQTQRAAPLVPEMLKAIDHVIALKKQRYRENSLNNLQSPIEQLEYAATHNKTADPEFVQLCLKTLRAKLDGKLNAEEFTEHCNQLDSMAKAISRSKRAQKTTSHHTDYLV